jgi:GMP synthase PP-ATPase subunit
VLPFDEFVVYKTTLSLLADGAGEDSAMTNVISMRQVPDKIYIVVRPQYRSQKAYWSNNLCYPIPQVNITFNNKASFLSEMDAYSSYQMSRRNGSQQSWSEFRGVVRNGNGVKYSSQGSIIVIDPRFK